MARHSRVATFFEGRNCCLRGDCDPVIRSYRLAKQEQRIIMLIAIEPPKRDPWVAVVGIGGVKLESAE